MATDKKTPELTHAFERGTSGLPVNYLSLHQPRDEGFGTHVTTRIQGSPDWSQMSLDELVIKGAE